MEKKLIEEWLKINFNSGFGAGISSGHGYSSGAGCGYDYGEVYNTNYDSAFGYSPSSGYGTGNASGAGTYYGFGFGFGHGYGSGNDSGCGYGTGAISDDNVDSNSNLKKYNKNYIFLIDGVYTIIKSIKGNVAKGYILNQDLTIEKTYIVKGNNMFAHGKNLKEAIQSLQNKIFKYMDVDKKINEFIKTFNKVDKYKGTEFFKWHHLLTGSCLQGRNNFIHNKNLDINAKYTVNEFLDIVKDAYGWNIIKKLIKYYKEGDNYGKNNKY